MRGGAGQASGNVVSVAPSLSQSVCPGFSPDLCKAEPLGVMQVGPLDPRGASARSQKEVLSDVLCGGSTSQVHKKVSGMASTPKPESSGTESAQSSPPWPRQLIPQRGLSSAEWGERESRVWAIADVT